MSLTTLVKADPEKVSMWGKLIRDIGVPILMLIAMSFAMYQGGMWIGNNILIPTLEKNEELVDTQMKSNQALLTSLNQITDNIKQQTEANQANTKAIVQISTDIAAIRSATEATAKDGPRFFEEQKHQSEILEKLLAEPN